MHRPVTKLGATLMSLLLACSSGDPAAPDTQPPTISLTSPGSGEIQGIVTITADANDDHGVAGVRFRLNGADLGAEDLEPAYTMIWNTLEQPDGEYTLTGMARDGAGNQATTPPLVVTVRNSPPPTGSVEVTTVTTGDRTDPDGYTVLLAGQEVAIAADGVVTIPSIPVGVQVVSLRGAAPYCFVATALVTVAADALSRVTFEITCTHPVVELMYSAWDLFTIRTDGTGTSRLVSSPEAALLHPVWSPDGQKIAFARLQNGMNLVVRSLIDGSETQLTADPTAYHQFPKWSPDGSKITYDRCLRDCDVWVVNADGTGAVNLTQTPDYRDQYPGWSPDGSKIVFSRTRDLNEDLYVMNSDGSEVIRLTQDASPEKSPVWSPDGSRILFVSERNGNFDLYVMGADGSNQIRLTDDPAVDASPAWAPDGLRIAFTRGVIFTGLNTGALWVMNADGSNEFQVTHTPVGEAGPAWRP